MFRRRLPLIIGLTVLVATSGSLEPAHAKAKKPAKTKAGKSKVVFQNENGIYQFPKHPGKWGVPAPAVFRPCFENIECALVETPMNYADPFSPGIEVSVVRHRATDPAQRIGSLFVNPGGPGGSTATLVRAAERIFPPEYVARFDIIGVDPRGTTNSAPVSCGVEPVDAEKVFTNEQFVRTVAEACGKRSGQLLKYIDTETATRDLDYVRQALGEAQVSFLGYSYGGYLGAMYAQMFPTTLRAVILDSGLDHTPFGSGTAIGKTTGWERSLRSFLSQCQDGTFTACAFNDGTDLLAKYDKILAYYPDPTTRRRNSTSPRYNLEGLVLDLLSSKSQNGWKILADGLQKASTSTGDPVRSFDLSSFRSGGRDYDVFESFYAYACRDGQYQRDRASLDALPAQLATIAPHFYIAATSFPEQMKTCLYWPQPIKPQQAIRPNGIAPVLLVGASLDSVTPIEWQQSMVATTGGTLITRVGADHGQVGRKTCVDPIAVDFMLNLVLPAPNLVCEN
jgi:pimeloyl-ACP methyl ester carboxylesterase